VASQTIQGLSVTNEAVNLPIFRPLIGLDKVDIIEMAQDIETFETSILPFEDCCTVFLPKHPVTKPDIKDIKESEEALDVELLIDRAIENMETYVIE
jgi:thiamine biosynthesis protein ThiI